MVIMVGSGGGPEDAARQIFESRFEELLPLRLERELV